MPRAFLVDVRLSKVQEVAEDPDLEKASKVFDTEHNLTSKKKKKEKKEFTSLVEKFFSLTFAPELMTLSGRLVVFTIWVLLGIASIYGCMHMKFDLSLEYFIPAKSSVDKFFDLDLRYFESGFTVQLFVYNSEVDYSSSETQYQMLDFYDKIQRNYLCEHDYFINYTLKSWYLDFRQWVTEGNCRFKPDGLPEPFHKIVPPEIYYPCLKEYTTKDEAGIRHSENHIRTTYQF